MAYRIPLKDRQSPIVIVGAGVFGLSSAIHLAKRGFTDITLLDRQPYHETLYDFDKGCDAASADCNKIVRAAYGDEIWYQDLTFRAIEVWESWNRSLAEGTALPPGITSQDRIYVNCGNYHFGDKTNGLNDFEKLSVDNITKAGRSHTQYLLYSDPKEVTRATANGLSYVVDPFRLSKDGEYQGYLDMIGGFVYADKACIYALHLAKELGVKLVLHRQAGSFESFLNDPTGKVVGVKTADGKHHQAEATIVACGGWTPSLVPELDGLCETTAGSIAMIQIPERSPLRERFSPENFPVFQWNTRAGENGNLYGFPLDNRGVMKIGYRGTKYTNPQEVQSGQVRSIPITMWTSPSITGLPEKSIRVVQNFLDRYLPELKQSGIGISQTRLCWYTDSFDNNWVIDNIPGKDGVIVATGGSGHAFKFLPLLGEFVADKVMGIESEMLRRFQWRKLSHGDTPRNRLMKGFKDMNALYRVRMVPSNDRQGHTKL
ncbi:FAD dependent oxidoreductase [Aspergillus bertholletiae]|uniref:FAD dependent oxidoreductase n=1 Tax=Aspergillus bertholletiae TaxID=1226010 RepID=A0A5N7B2B7_9EURO|nr:FAD dependent oxidoreductase [Aspergillus bertholletiae]